MSLETYAEAERLICGTGGISRLCEVSLARLSVLYLELLQLQKRMSVTSLCATFSHCAFYNELLKLHDDHCAD